MSACLLGERVRYDGDHRRSPRVAEELGRLFEWVVICPEVEAGFGVPRETLQLEGESARPRLVTTQTRLDRTEEMRAWCRARVDALPRDLCGFVFKAGSPSCGPRDVRLYTEGAAAPEPIAVGLFAHAVGERFPDLPVADEEELADPARTADFVRRVQDLHPSRRS